MEAKSSGNSPLYKDSVNRRKIAVIIQARMGSTRLPGKVLLDLEGRPVLTRVIERVLKSKKIDRIVIATTDKDEDRAIVQLVEEFQNPIVGSFRGAEHDVLDRYFKAAQQFEADIVVRITSDCPLIDPEVIDKVVNRFLTSGADYVANILSERTYPRGLDVEVFSFDALKKIWEMAESSDDREHVTLYVRKNPTLFKTKNVRHGRDYSFHRWTLDEQSDYKLLKLIYKNVYTENPDFTMEDVIGFFEKNPEAVRINQNVKQKLFISSNT